MSRPDKERLFELIAQVAHAIANPHRLELLDLLVQAPRSVEQLATAAALSVANASQHLQRLKRAGLVVGERHGTTIRYRLADPAVARLWTELRRLALAQQADAERALDRYRPGRRRYPRGPKAHGPWRQGYGPEGSPIRLACRLAIASVADAPERRSFAS